MLGETELKKIFPNFEDLVQPSGIDLELDEIFVQKSEGSLLDNEKNLPEIEALEGPIYTLKPHTAYLASIKRKVKIPKGYTMLYLPRSTLLRSFISVQTAVGDPGFYGTLMFMIYNHGDFEYKIKSGDRIAQAVVFPVEGSGEYTADIVVGADEKDDGYNYPLIYNHGVNLRIVNKNESKGTFRICSVLGTNAYNSLEKTTGGKYKTITFNPNGGEITTDLQYVCESKSVYLKYAYGLGLKRDGYNFKGWSTQPDEDTIAYKDGALIEVEEDITLYAIWELQ